MPPPAGTTPAIPAIPAITPALQPLQTLPLQAIPLQQPFAQPVQYPIHPSVVYLLISVTNEDLLTQLYQYQHQHLLYQPLAEAVFPILQKVFHSPW